MGAADEEGMSTLSMCLRSPTEEAREKFIQTVNEKVLSVDGKVRNPAHRLNIAFLLILVFCNTAGSRQAGWNAAERRWSFLFIHCVRS
jgi:hypothetical protein